MSAIRQPPNRARPGWCGGLPLAFDHPVTWLSGTSSGGCGSPARRQLPVASKRAAPWIAWMGWWS
jgi:hypothetical protein